MVIFMWQKSHYYTLLVICLDISSRDELIWFCLPWCVVLHAFRVYWYAFVSRSEDVSVCMLYTVTETLQVSSCGYVCWCHFKRLVLSCPILCSCTVTSSFTGPDYLLVVSGSAGLLLLLSVSLPVYLLCCLSQLKVCLCLCPQDLEEPGEEQSRFDTMVPTVVRPQNQMVSPYSSNDEVWPSNMKGFKIVRLFMALHLKEPRVLTKR